MQIPRTYPNPDARTDDRWVADLVLVLAEVPERIVHLLALLNRGLLATAKSGGVRPHGVTSR